MRYRRIARLSESAFVAAVALAAVSRMHLEDLMLTALPYIAAAILAVSAAWYLIAWTSDRAELAIRRRLARRYQGR